MLNIYGINDVEMVVNYGYAVCVNNLVSNETVGLLPAIDGNKPNTFNTRESAFDYAGLYSIMKAKETDVIYVSRVGFTDKNIPVSSNVVARILAGGEIVNEDQRVKLVAVTENINN